MTNRICAFTGHRNLCMGGFDANLLDRVVVDLIKTGTKQFLTGMALGFDLASAESVLSAKKNYDVKLTAVLPCANQTDRFSEGAKKKYSSILELCDRVITLSPEYYSGCMHERDRYLVDNSDILVCYLRKQSGGTFYTVNYAKKLGKKIIEL